MVYRTADWKFTIAFSLGKLQLHELSASKPELISTEASIPYIAHFINTRIDSSIKSKLSRLNEENVQTLLGSFNSSGWSETMVQKNDPDLANYKRRISGGLLEEELVTITIDSTTDSQYIIYLLELTQDGERLKAALYDLIFEIGHIK